MNTLNIPIVLLAAIMVILILLAGIVYLFITLRKTEQKAQQSSAGFLELENRLNTLHLQTLESKLNPHLFKNILNSFNRTLIKLISRLINYLTYLTIYCMKAATNL